MQTILHGSLYLVYAAANTAAMMTVRRAVQRLSRRRRRGSLGTLLLGGALYAAAIAILLTLLRWSEASTVFPIAVGCTVLATNLAGAHYYREPITGRRLLGTSLIVAGIALLLVDGAPT